MNELSHGATLASRIRSWVSRVGKLEDRLFDDPDGSARRIEVIELEMAVLKAVVAKRAGDDPGAA